MKVTLCDECRKEVTAEGQNLYRDGDDLVELKISIKGEPDLCGPCARKIMCRAARRAHDELKIKRNVA